ncbi:hypothetical protein SKAU_G00013810 [Synaphobranchus kaupii]|uniref:Uncharacterized protein n=1 Tax=Synaphobranchus kaupii TaxID=118154 RepID=A0A9Q1GBH7_SYNKA|nr:hypothetical protein SKAU_G00013810 [Synaphobranchus kaupii]
MAGRGRQSAGDQLSEESTGDAGSERRPRLSPRRTGGCPGELALAEGCRRWVESSMACWDTAASRQPLVLCKRQYSR